MQAATGSHEGASAPAARGIHRLRRFTAKKVLMSVGALGTAASIAGLATFATFTSTTTAVTPTTASGTVAIVLGATGAVTNRLNIGATGLAAGDSLQRTVDLINSGDLALASITLGTSAVTSSVLDTDLTKGLHMVIDECSVPWTETVVGSGFTYACGGSAQTMLASTPVIGSAIDLSALFPAASLTPGSVDHLRVTLTLPQVADNTFMGKTSTISYIFTATQRNATAK